MVILVNMFSVCRETELAYSRFLQYKLLEKKPTMLMLIYLL